MLSRKKRAASFREDMQISRIELGAASEKMRCSKPRPEQRPRARCENSSGMYDLAVSQKVSLCKLAPPSVPMPTGTPQRPRVSSVPRIKRARDVDGFRLATTPKIMKELDSEITSTPSNAKSFTYLYNPNIFSRPCSAALSWPSRHRDPLLGQR